MSQFSRFNSLFLLALIPLLNACFSQSDRNSFLSLIVDGTGERVLCNSESRISINLGSVTPSSNFTAPSTSGSASVPSDTCDGLASKTIPLVPSPSVQRSGNTLLLLHPGQASDEFTIDGSTLRAKASDACENGRVVKIEVSNAILNSSAKRVEFSIIRSVTDETCPAENGPRLSRI